MDIKLTGALDVRDGYGYITQNLALALDKLGHTVWVNPVKIWASMDQLDPKIHNLMGAIKPDFELLIMYPTYNFGMVHKSAAIMTMYESHICPPVWTKRLNQMKLPIFAPSQFVADMFKESGVTVPIKVLSLGVNTDFYLSRLRKFPKDRPFRFLTMGKLEPRKNVITLVTCFQKAFPTEDVELVIKTREHFLPNEIRIIAQEDKRIRIIEKTITEEELRKLFYYCDCFVYPSRGEGFAFPPRNAIATGMPTMVTNWSALAEIPGAIGIKVKELGPMPPCGFSYGEHGKMHMAIIDEDNLVAQMKTVALREDFYDILAEETFKIEQHTWLDCAKDFIKLVER